MREIGGKSSEKSLAVKIKGTIFRSCYQNVEKNKTRLREIIYVMR